ncbi:MAG: pantoate--beta-alanine ligase [Streptosporangiales bacterium]|nr:pantoate--beta-alanine ligase [Streptosporangiales bacterium]
MTGPVLLAHDISELDAVRAKLGADGRTVALVPTMGALHEGHRALIRRARELAGAAVVSIFVNPRQFGPGEDFERYPRTLETDLEICREEGVAAAFVPSVDVMYPDEQVVTVSSGPMGAVFEGAHRPGHFDGVLTVVLKLLNLVRPDVALFGQKDGQQLAMIRRMARDLNVPVRIEGVPTVREPGGLALSSRNRYLSAEERETALALSRALRAGESAAAEGPAAVLAAGRAVLDEAARARPPLAVDYLGLVDPDSFAEVTPEHRGRALLVVAARVGATRLIDNVPLTLER